MVNQDKLTILQYNNLKSRKEVMIPLFENEQIKEVDIIALQEPWRNPWKHIIYHPLKSFFDLVYEDRKDTRVCFYMDKTMVLAELTIHIHNIYNPCNSNVEDERSSTIPTLLRAIEKHPNGM